jgi:hypothetical protein
MHYVMIVLLHLRSVAPQTPCRLQTLGGTAVCHERVFAGCVEQARFVP